MVGFSSQSYTCNLEIPTQKRNRRNILKKPTSFGGVPAINFLGCKSFKDDPKKTRLSISTILFPVEQRTLDVVTNVFKCQRRDSLLLSEQNS